MQVGGTPATGVSVASTTQLGAVAPAHDAGVVDVVVRNSDGQTGTLAAAFTYDPPPTMGNTNPYFGTTAGGEPVAISFGKNFVAGAQVRFDGIPATGVTVTGPATLNLTTPAHDAGWADVTIQNPDGQADTQTAAFLFVTRPTVAQVAPALGTAAGGTPVSISSTGFAAGAKVLIGNVQATNVTFVDPTELTAITPPHASGPVDVVVTVLPAVSSAPLGAGFTYLDAPTLTSVSPSSGTGLGGTPVTLTGTNFYSGAKVNFGGVAATSAVVVNATTITAVTPRHGAGAVDVTVTNPDGEIAQRPGAFTYDAAPPEVQAVSPSFGPEDGGTVVTVSGSAFLPDASVAFDGVEATNVIFQSDTVLTATAPPHAAGPVLVRVTNTDGQTGALDGGFTFVAPPSLVSLSPASGPVAGGVTVTLLGRAFQSGAVVFFGGTRATVTASSDVSLSVTAPSHPAGTVDVVVQNADGQESVARSFEYVAAPAVFASSPNVGPTAGGTAVIVTGSGFKDGATVTVGGEPATQVQWIEQGTLHAVTPAHAAGRVDVVVQNPDGQSGMAQLAFEFSDACATCAAPKSRYSFGCSSSAGGLGLDGLGTLSVLALWLRARRLSRSASRR